MGGVRSPAEAKDFSSCLYVQTSSDAHLASYTMGNGGPFLGGKARPGRDADHSPHPMPKSRMSRSYVLSPWCLQGVAGQLYESTRRHNIVKYEAITSESWNVINDNADDKVIIN
jgi:hypothetical protein